MSYHAHTPHIHSPSSYHSHTPYTAPSTTRATGKAIGFVVGGVIFFLCSVVGGVVRYLILRRRRREEVLLQTTEITPSNPIEAPAPAPTIEDDTSAAAAFPTKNTTLAVPAKTVAAEQV
jgi:hypothetical protein